MELETREKELLRELDLLNEESNKFIGRLSHDSATAPVQRYEKEELEEVFSKKKAVENELRKVRLEKSSSGD